MGRIEFQYQSSYMEGGRLRINVKDHTIYRNHYLFADLIEQLDTMNPDIVEHLYQHTVEDFWEIAQDLATEAGLPKVEQTGRSGGWLEVNYDPIVLTQGKRIELQKFVDEIEGTMQAAQEMFLARLQDAWDEIQAKREANEIRSEN